MFVLISIWSIDRILSGPGRDGNEGVLCIPQNTNITGASASDCLVSYPGHSLEESYPSAEIQSVYSAAPSDRASHFLGEITLIGVSTNANFNIFSFFSCKLDCKLLYSQIFWWGDCVTVTYIQKSDLYNTDCNIKNFRYSWNTI